MNIKEMHYDVKFKLNKVDSHQYRNLKVPEIDWALNRAAKLYIKTNTQPKKRNLLGFEINQRVLDSVRTLVVDDFKIDAVKGERNSFTAQLPENYMFYVSGSAIADKGNCKNAYLRLLQKEHDDRHEDTAFHDSSFEWREVNIEFFDDKIKAYSDGSFEIKELSIDYIKEPIQMHNAESFRNGSYKDLKGNVLTGTQDCDLPKIAHEEIVDLAVLIISGSLDHPNYKLKVDKINLNN